MADVAESFCMREQSHSNRSNSRSQTLLAQLLPKSIRGFLVLQLRIGLSLTVLLPIIANWHRFSFDTGLFLLFCASPLLALIFLVNRKNLVWTLILLILTGCAGFSGFLVVFVGAGRESTAVQFMYGTVAAIFTWIFAIAGKYAPSIRDDKKQRDTDSNGEQN